MKVVSWDGHNINDGTNYTATLQNVLGLPGVAAQWVKRIGRWPLIGGLDRPGRKLTLGLAIEGAAVEMLRAQLNRWFDPEDETPKALVIQDDDSSHERYVWALCEALQQNPTSGGRIFIATLAAHDDARWRSTGEDSDIWTITASGQTRTVTNSGQDDAYPRLTVKPTGNKSGDYSYKRFVPVRWRVSDAYAAYPVDVCNDGFDTATLVTAGKMQADGDDLRVWVDGVEVGRWLAGINTSTTQVWVNLDFQAKQEATLAAAMGSGDTVTTLDVIEDTSGFPSSGILIIDNEAFIYTGKNDNLKRFTGVTRAAKGTTAAGHSSGATLWWCQHDTWLLYGNSSATAPSVDDDYKPIFSLASTNIAWDYDEFGEDDGLRGGAWTKQILLSTPTFYTANHGTDADPWSEIGIQVNSLNDIGMWRLFNPCGITAANFQNGEKYRANAYWRGELKSSLNGSTWSLEYSIPSPAAQSTWESWSQNETLIAGSKYVGMYLEYLTGTIMYLEAADVTITLDSSNTPTVIIGDEQGNYSLACTITNTTTDDAIQLAYTMALNDELEVDTAAKTVIDLSDDSSQFQALALVGGARRDWLPLQPGNNTLRFDDTGTTGVTITIEWEERYYE